ncbi:MAG: type II toxin-antitoxin system VapC family toxin [Thermoanaerobaculia bacterium]
MRLLLDTSIFLWYLSGDSRLAEGVGEAIRSPDNEVWLSVVSFWEILVKHQLGRLPLPEAPHSYIPKRRARHGIESLALDEEALVHLPKLPEIHRDPFDRMLVSQAIEHEMSLVTSDDKLRAYPVKLFSSP